MTESEIIDTFSWLCWPMMILAVAAVIAFGYLRDDHRYSRDIKKWRKASRKDK